MTVLARRATKHGTAAVVDAVRAAVVARTGLRLTGSGTWLDAGRPVRAATTLSLAPLSGVTDYTPGDLTLTAGAGTTLAELAAVTRVERQWLPFDPFGAPDGTLGATVATASAGPLAHALGLPRDNVLGLEFVTGTGAVVRAGGRVVKNVAGFDLVRVLVGSWGTLGAITEVTIRLRAIPDVDVTLALPFPAAAAAGAAPLRDRLAGALDRLRSAPLAPLALELLSAPLAERVGCARAPTLLVRLAGNEELVRSQRAALAALGDPAEAPPDAWTRLYTCEPPAAAVVRLSSVPSRLSDTWAHAAALGEALPGALTHASVGRGVVRCILPGGDVAALAGALGAPFDGTRIFERLPSELWPSLAPSPVADRLSRGVKRAYDPSGILNPGILGDYGA